MADSISVSEAALTGDRSKTLISMRDRLAQDIDSTQTMARDRAALIKQLQDVLREIDALPKETAGTTLGNIRNRRNKRNNDK